MVIRTRKMIARISFKESLAPEMDVDGGRAKRGAREKVGVMMFKVRSIDFK